MKLEFYEEHHRLSLGSGSVGIYRRLPHLEGGSDLIEDCYLQAADAMEQWAKEIWAPQLTDAFRKTARQSRLHRVMPRLLFVCTGNLTEDRFLSLTLTVTQEASGGKTISCDRRVWDGTSGLLCPIALFLSRKHARQFDEWQFELRGNDEVYALPAKSRAKSSTALICAGNRKIFQ